MAWVRLDDHADEDPRLAQLGEFAGLGLALRVGMLCYAGRHLTDGLVPRGAVGRLVEIPRACDVSADVLADRLAAAGILEPAGDDAWRIVQYHAEQPSREQIEMKRAAVSAVRREAALKRWGSGSSSNARKAAKSMQTMQTGCKPDADDMQGEAASGQGAVDDQASGGPGSSKLAPSVAFDMQTMQTGCTPDAAVHANAKQAGCPRPRSPYTQTKGARDARGGPASAFTWERGHVPMALHRELIGKLGGDRAQAEARLLTWYRQTAATWPPDQVVHGNDFVFWRDRFDEWQQPKRTKAIPPPSAGVRAAVHANTYGPWMCPHQEPPCGSERICDTVFAREVVAGARDLEDVPLRQRERVSSQVAVRRDQQKTLRNLGGIPQPPAPAGSNPDEERFHVVA